MFSTMDFAEFAATILAQKTEPRLRKLLQERGVTSPNDLPKEVADEIFRQATIETAALHFPEAHIDALDHGLRSFTNPAFLKSLNFVKAHLALEYDAFAMAAGVDIAIVLAGLGLPVAPFDRKNPKILADPSNDVDTVVANFGKWKTAFVGYSVCDVPFYIALTDCARTLSRRVNSDSRLADLRSLFERCGERIRDPEVAFQPAMAMFPREPEDRISTVVLHDPNPTSGSIALYAGWRTETGTGGAPNNGFIPVPLQFVHAVLDNVQTAFWLWRPVGGKSTMQ